MSDEKNTNQKPEETPTEYVPSSPTRRVIAWVGVAYMVILVLLNFYALSTGGWIRGIAPLMLSPAVAGLGVVTVLNYRSGKGRGGLPACLFITGLCAVVLVYSLVTGIPGLFGQIGGAA